MKKEKLINDVLQGLLMAAVVAAAIPMPDLVFAQDLNTTVTTLTGKELTSVPDVIGAVFYIGGAAFCGAGLLKLKQHADNPTQVKLGEGVGRLSVGAGLLALPYISNAAITTFGYGQQAAQYTKFNNVQ